MLHKPIHIVGMRPGSLEISEQSLSILEQAEVVVGGKRLLAALALLSSEQRPIDPPRLIPISGALDAVIDRIRLCLHRRVVVLADGDPLFYGFARKIVAAFGADKVIVLPHLSTLQVAAARLRMPWEQVKTVSLHGRNDFGLLYSALMQYSTVAVLTDTHNTPAEIAKALLQKGIEGLSMTVLEDLDTPQERIRRLTLHEVWDLEFSSLNLVLIEREIIQKHALCLGIPDQLYIHENNLITKQAVRATGISLLQVQPEHTVWDLGSGCGAVAIEISSLATRGRVYAVEKNRKRLAMIRENVRCFGALLVEIVHGDMTSAVNNLPAPDRVFIGGGLGGKPEKSESILDAVTDILAAQGRIVFHCILLETLLRVKSYFENKNWVLGITQVQASTSNKLGDDLRFKAQNPVFILWAEKP